MVYDAKNDQIRDLRKIMGLGTGTVWGVRNNGSALTESIHATAAEAREKVLLKEYAPDWTIDEHTDDNQQV